MIGRDLTWRKIYAGLQKQASFPHDSISAEELAAETGMPLADAEDQIDEWLMDAAAESSGAAICEDCGYEHPIGAHDHDIDGDTGLQGQRPEDYQSMPPATAAPYCDACDNVLEMCKCSEAPKTEMGRLLEELAQGAYSKSLDELTYEEMFSLQQALKDSLEPAQKVYEIG